MIAVMVYLLVIPCIIKTNGDFALRCDCCAQPVTGEGRPSPVSVIRISDVTNKISTCSRYDIELLSLEITLYSIIGRVFLFLTILRRMPVTNIMVVTPMGAPEATEEHWLHRPRLDDR